MGLEKFLFFTVILFAIASPIIYVICVLSGRPGIGKTILPIGIVVTGAYFSILRDSSAPLYIGLYVFTIYPAIGVILIAGIPPWIPNRAATDDKNSKPQ